MFAWVEIYPGFPSPLVLMNVVSVRREAALHDLCYPVALTAAARIVPARAAACGQVTASIDLIAAYPTVVLGGKRRVMPLEERASDVREAATPSV